MSAERTVPKTRRATLAAIAVITTTAVCLIAACGSESGDGSSIPRADGGEGGTFDGSFGSSGNSPNEGGIPVIDSAVPGECDGVDPARDLDCTGKCGPVRDFCTGKVKQCGGCPDVDGNKQACDLTTNSCGTPKKTCSDLGAECGTVKNTCGEYLDCPDGNTKGCGAGKECDPDTNKCRECQQVSCQDLGYECGFAWLGCGPDNATNQTDCGQCADGPGGEKRTCNAQFHKCEPQCTPKSKEELCNAAKASSKKVECGRISNGCGGTVDCSTVAGFGCAAGESCGVRGIANRCDRAATPDECRAVGRTCGKITSACSGQEITCGFCAAGEVCNDNGICGVPCQPKTCNDFKDFECGTFDDSCGGKVTCGSCTGGVCDQTTNTCCKAKTCAADYDGKCGDDLATGCGTATLDCNCAGGRRCTTNGGDTGTPGKGTPGQCCQPKTTASFAGQCGTQLSDGCGGTINVNCAAGQYCVNNQNGTVGDAPPNGVAGTCCTPGGKCSDAPANTCASIPNSCRPNGQPAQNCSGNCTNPRPSCVGGNCCTPAASCGTNGVGGKCNVTNPGNGCGSDRPCNCAANLTCMCGDKPCESPSDGQGVCTGTLTCATAAPGGCGTGIDNGTGGTINCGCGAGRVCSTSTPGAIGVCRCDNPTNNPYTCANVPNGPNTGGNACGSFSNGCGGNLNCNCASGLRCDTSDTPRTCCTPPAACTGGGNEGAECNTRKPANGCGADNVCNCAGGRACWCGDHACTAADGPGQCKGALTCSSPVYAGKCGTNLPNGVGGTINCGSCGAGKKCSTTTPGQTGTCICDNGTNNPFTCANVPNGPSSPNGDKCGPFSDGCGGSLNCGCPSGQTCHTAATPNACCTPLKCDSPMGIGSACGTLDNTCGGTVSCGCPSGAANANFKCTNNKCECVKDTCRGRSGPQPDLCGGELQCDG